MKFVSYIVTSTGLALGVQAAYAADPSLEEKVQVLQREIDQLKGQVAGSRAADTGSRGATTIGGYGELIYNNYRESERSDQADLRRFVIFLGHRFNERLRFHSELEVEHAFVEGGEGGEVAMEQAYLEYGLTPRANVRAGLMLVPLGILNETHEPPTFFGVERNQVESVIIPSTWRELGVALQGEATPGLEYNVGLSTSLDSGRFEEPEKGLRETRSGGGEAAANDLGVFAALNYRGIPGLLVGGGLFTGNTGHDGASNSALEDVSARVTLWDVHARYAVGGWDLQALYARGTLSDADAVSAASGEVAPKSLYGWYVQAAYHVWKRGDLDLAPFVRFERYNTQHEVADGFAADPLNDEKVTTVGANFYLHPQVVLKADFQNFRADDTKDRFNLGVGYMF
ncbi:MAG TPA: porin [Burkholderiales bacterium]